MRPTLQCTMNSLRLLARSPCRVKVGLASYCTPAESTDEKKQPPHPHAWRTPWHEKEGEWYTSFKLFASKSSPDFIRFMQQDIDLRPSSIRQWWHRKLEENELFNQRYIPERHQILGNDLAAAHFIVHRGGAVRFEGSPHWLRRDGKGEYNLPKKFVKNLFVDAIDASHVDIQYEGFANLVSLKKLRVLRLKGCRFVDDWCLDRISAEYVDTLDELDISQCPEVTERGLTVLHRLRRLRHLNVEGIAESAAVKLACLMLEELSSQLVISGVSHPNVSLQP
ncbi:hypothetical protein B566_EDAN012468 [Ephemera danica]|nr:hypothetical protein B566_EDAN012468 [Ephemera danica]